MQPLPEILVSTMLAFNMPAALVAILLVPAFVIGQDEPEPSGTARSAHQPNSRDATAQDGAVDPGQRRYSIRDAFPPRLAPPHVRGRTIYGHPAFPYPAYAGAWGTGWHLWGPSGGVDGLGYRYQYHTHVPGLGVKYYRGPVKRYYPGPYGASPLTGFSHYGYGPYGW